MLSKTDEEFTKYKSGSDWKLQMSGRKAYMLFDKDGNFKYMGQVL